MRVVETQTMPPNETTTGVRQSWSTVPREPTNVMIQAGREAGDYRVLPGDDRVAYRFEPARDEAEVINIWHAMFDRAFKDTALEARIKAAADWLQSDDSAYEHDREAAMRAAREMLRVSDEIDVGYGIQPTSDSDA